ncbi:MAG: hypothetical protein HY365_01325 [Candidatus Aenigmarchaeota archaeon]|nr:hypothetical protein [Candidatus Aenigmarchaeota archaeon]
MLIIVDNGSGAQEISGFLRAKNAIMKPKDALNAEATGYIFSDGDPKNMEANLDILDKSGVPVLGIGAGGLFIGAAYDAEVKPMKFPKTDKLMIKKPCPLTLDMKKSITVAASCSYGFSSVPENFNVVASSPINPYAILQETENPFFIVCFNPEQGMEGRMILDNFEKFVEVWKEYHK